MRLGRKLLVLVAFAALATFFFGGAPSVATGEIIHPCWDIDKRASVTNLTLSLGQTFTINYEVIVTKRECLPGETPHESVDVRDSFAGTLALHLNESRTFRYSRDITARTCDDFDVVNRAEVLNATVLDFDVVTIRVDVACERGCTLTQGYWKTHSNQGPAPLDTTWNLLPQAELTTAFLPNVDAKGDPGTWYSVFWTSPSGGNVYYQLAHQYMAAKLNKLNGASSTAAVDAAIAAADTFFATYTPAEAGALGKDSTARKDALALAGTLASYNEGAIGPGHCDE